MSQKTLEDQYQWLIDQGKRCTNPANSDAQLVPGCPSNTYFSCTIQEGKYYISGESTSYIVAGIIQVIVDIYHLQYVDDRFTSSWHNTMNLQGILTYQRWIGVKYMIDSLIKVS